MAGFRGPRLSVNEATDVLVARQREADQARSLEELRRQQAAFRTVRDDLDRQNSWMAIPALAPVAALLGLEFGGALAANAARSGLSSARPLNLLEPEVWQRGPQRIGARLPRTVKDVLRSQARARFERANGARASELGADVHHSDPLEWAHLKPDADPNRLANLWALPREVHDIASQQWAAFSRSLNGRPPTQAEIMALKLRIDRQVAPYLRRPGTTWSSRK